MKYKVKAGDTLGGVAASMLGDYRRYKELAWHNGIGYPHIVKEGQTIDIPNEITIDKVIKALFDIGVTSSNARKYIEYIMQTIKKYNIDSYLRVAHYLSQICHESGNMRFAEENLNYSEKALMLVFPKYFDSKEIAKKYARKPNLIASRVYANRMLNGDEKSQDGWKFRGRGLIQISGKSNYIKASKELEVDLIKKPCLLSENNEYATLSSGWYWNRFNINEMADQDDIISITKKINGGLNGIEDRKKKLELAKQSICKKY